MSSSTMPLPDTIPSNIYKPKEPFMATVLENRRLTSEGSPNDVRHVVFDLSGSILRYLDGQSLGVLPPGSDPEGKPHKLRLYSIASPGIGDDGQGKTASLCVKRLIYTNPQGEEVRGVCSNYICDLQPGEQVAVTGPVGKSFLLPDEPDANLIMIATGTGIAPFRAFWKTRFNQRRQEQGQAHLFFGAPYSSDILYREELNTLQGAESLFRLHLAISREQQTFDGQKMYVQNKLAEAGETVFSLLENPKTYLYICGLKGMETGILQALEQTAVKLGKNWEQLYSQLKQEKRWHIEVY